MRLDDLIRRATERAPGAIALGEGEREISYETLCADMRAFAHGLIQLGVQRGERIGVYLDK
ncbi:MAG TPA: AMP-binding protein, partial [Rhodocyclaceae bacterium]|nr:AMP-binding protein [Rhodocyclaceae bacterium]